MTRWSDIWTEYSYQICVASVVVTSLCAAQYIRRVSKYVCVCVCAPLHKSSNPFPIGRIRLRPKINFQKFFIKVR